MNINSTPPSSRIIVDRYALPSGADPNACNTADQTWCGGTWNTIRENLDYVQDQGFTASACPASHSPIQRLTCMATPPKSGSVP